ncbi:MAG: hypothetical protein K5655_02165 [Lachnospiraceae bacterium]|nr:hypothetical protein [Lachnospiraceae bacterium]
MTNPLDKPCIVDPNCQSANYQDYNGPKYYGIGVRDDINLAKNVLLKESQPVTAQTDFEMLFYGETPYSNGIEVRGNGSLYLYFGVNVQLFYMMPSYIDGGDANVLNGDGNLVSLGSLITSSPYYNAATGHDDSFVPVKFREHPEGKGEDYDQYWSVGKSPSTATLKSLYFGKPLDIPVICADGSENRFVKADYNPTYTSKTQGYSYSYITLTQPTVYTNSNHSGYTSAVHLGSSASGNGLPGIDGGYIHYCWLGYNVLEEDYVNLDLSGVSYTEGSSYGYLFDDSEFEDSGKVKVEAIYNSGVFYISIDEPPRTQTYSDWLLTISKTGHRLVGFEIKYPSESVTVTDRLLFSTTPTIINSDLTYSQNDYEFAKPTSVGTALTSKLKLKPNIPLGPQTVIKPIYMPEAPFKFDLIRDEGTMRRPAVVNGDNSIFWWTQDGYKVVISDIWTNAEGKPYVTEINLSQLSAKAFEERDTESAYFPVPLNRVLRWETREGSDAYYLYEYNTLSGEIGDAVVVEDGQLNYTIDNSGKVTMPLTYLGTFYEVSNPQWQHNKSAQFVSGIGVLDDSCNVVNSNSRKVGYTVEIGGQEIDCDISNTGNTGTPFRTTFAPEEYLANLFTAVYAKTDIGGVIGENYIVQTVFCESRDTLPDNMLQLLSGRSDFGLMWYGGELDEMYVNGHSCYGSGMVSDGDLAEMFPWTVTRNTSGTGKSAALAIKNRSSYTNQAYGSGVLVFEIHKYLHLPINTGQGSSGNNANSVRVYDPSCYSNGVITPREDSDSYKTLLQFIDPTGQTALPADLYLQLELSSDVNVPDGWAEVIAYVGGNPSPGYIYYGDGDVAGKAIASFSPFEPH